MNCVTEAKESVLCNMSDFLETCISALVLDRYIYIYSIGGNGAWVSADVKLGFHMCNNYICSENKRPKKISFFSLHGMFNVFA